MKQEISKWFWLSVAVGLLGCAEVRTPVAQSPLSNEGRQTLSQMAPPPPAPVPPNASRVTATVRKYAVLPPGSLKKTLPLVSPDQTLYSLTVEIHTSQPENSGLESFARPGTIIEAFSTDEFASDLVGKKIEATLSLTGDTRGVRWQISKVRTLP